MKPLFLLLPWLALVSCGADAKVRSASLLATDTLDAPARAATEVADNDAACTKVQPFYWEIGDGTGKLASGSAGSARYDEDSTLLIASSTKWLFASYVVEKLKGDVDAVTRDALHMRSGYTGFKSFGCRNSKTVADCYTDANASFNPSLVGKFYYDGGHFQKWSIDHGLGDMTNGELARELHGALGSDVPFTFSSPQLAGGISMTPAAYAVFLRKLINGKLRMTEFLGKDPVCTFPSKCSTAVYSPGPEDVHYSYGHWVEDDPALGDGAFSSAGLFGFYPWVSADKKYYGVLARQALRLTAGWDSLVCGRKIRKAYVDAATVAP